MLRYRGDFYRDLEEWDQAEAAYQQSLAVAIRQQAKSDELRTTMCLGRLWAQQGQKTKAQAALANVFEWFTEGFGTPDLIDAQKLLQEWI